MFLAGCLRLIMAGYAGHMHGGRWTKLSMAKIGWLDLVGTVWLPFRLDIDGFNRLYIVGWLWLAMAGYGWLWLAMAGNGWLA